MIAYIVRHAEALPEEIDPKRGLSERGIKQARMVGEKLKELGCAPEQILHSPKKRARETAEIIASFIKPPRGIVEAASLLPSDDVSIWAERLPYEEKDLMLVGHLPHVADLTARLTRDNSIGFASFDTCTAVFLERTKIGFKLIKRISPSILK